MSETQFFYRSDEITYLIAMVYHGQILLRFKSIDPTYSGGDDPC